MASADTGMRAAGGWLALASILLVVTLASHGPLAETPREQMAAIADGAARWGVVHWIAAISLTMFAVAGLLVLTAGSRLTGNPWTLSAWAVVPVGALWTVTTAVAEVTVVADAAVSGQSARFDAWWAFAEGKAAGFTFMALSVAVIALHEMRSARPHVPPWASAVGAIAGIASFGGWALGTWLGIWPGSPIWVVASLVMALWTLWLGVAMLRSPAA